MPPPAAYARTWLAEEDLNSLSRRIHDGVPLDQLMDRARNYRNWLFATYPGAQPQSGDRVLELGSGVGWIMEAMLEEFDIAEIVGLDISPNMIERARERFSDPKGRFVLYDGYHMPFPDDYFQTVYSVAAIQHIEKHVAFVLFEELHRLLAPGGHAILHVLAVEHIPGATPTYHDECWNHIRAAQVHWHHYYAFDELFVLFSQVIGVTDLDISYEPGSKSFLVHFSKGGASAYRRPELADLAFTRRLEAHSDPSAPSSVVAEVQRALAAPFQRAKKRGARQLNG